MRPAERKHPRGMPVRVGFSGGTAEEELTLTESLSGPATGEPQEEELTLTESLSKSAPNP